MTRCPASCCSVRPPGTAVELVVGGGFGVVVVVVGEVLVVVGDELLVVVDEEVVVGGVVVVVDDVVLPFAVADPLLEHAPLSSPTAATSVTAATPPVFLRRPLRIPTSAMDSTLAKSGLRCQPDGPLRCVAGARATKSAKPAL